MVKSQQNRIELVTITGGKQKAMLPVTPQRSPKPSQTLLQHHHRPKKRLSSQQQNLTKQCRQNVSGNFDTHLIGAMVIRNKMGKSLKKIWWEIRLQNSIPATPLYWIEMFCPPKLYL